jgi:hypothetical protein
MSHFHAAPPMACQGEWSAWSQCSVTCGDGTQTSSYNVTQPALNGGASCPNNTGEVMSQPCSAPACPCVLTVHAFVVICVKRLREPI